MVMSVVGAQMRKYMRWRIKRENIDSVPLGRTAKVAPMAPTPYLAEERPTNKCSSQHIERKIAEAAKVS